RVTTYKGKNFGEAFLHIQLIGDQYTDKKDNNS
ncbi:unnamed protein product, partial [marine sediment metagenome]